MTKAKVVNQFDTILNQLVGSLVRSVNEMPEAQAMAGKVKLTRAEQQARYLQNRDNPAFWNDIVAKHGRDGAFTYWQTMEKKNAHETIAGEPAGEPEAPGSS